MHAYITLMIPWERLLTQQGGQVRVEQALALLSSLCMQSIAGTLSVINSGINCLHSFNNRQNIVITVKGCKIFQPVAIGCGSNRLQPSIRASPSYNCIFSSSWSLSMYVSFYPITCIVVWMCYPNNWNYLESASFSIVTTLSLNISTNKA